jgi:hypothetical protein
VASGLTILVNFVLVLAGTNHSAVHFRLDSFPGGFPMHKILIIAATCLSMAACTTTQQGAAIGAVGGGVIGAAAGGSVLSTAVGAGVGAVVGAAAGDVVGRSSSGNNVCVYQRPDGSRYRDTCPRG